VSLATGLRGISCGRLTILRPRTEGRMMRTRADRWFRVGNHGFELILVAGVAIVSSALSVDWRDWFSHALFAISTMSFVHCTDCCREINDRHEYACDTYESLLKFNRKSAAEIYRQLRSDVRFECKLYRIVTQFSGLFWATGAVFYAKSLATHNFYFFTLGFCAAVSFTLAAWKVWLISGYPEQLEISTIAAGLAANGPEDLDEGELVALPR
jgi:hypothetical protein